MARRLLGKRKEEEGEEEEEGAEAEREREGNGEGQKTKKKYGGEEGEGKERGEGEDAGGRAPRLKKVRALPPTAVLEEEPEDFVEEEEEEEEEEEGEEQEQEQEQEQQREPGPAGAEEEKPSASAALAVALAPAPAQAATAHGNAYENFSSAQQQQRGAGRGSELPGAPATAAEAAVAAAAAATGTGQVAAVPFGAGDPDYATAERAMSLQAPAPQEEDDALLSCVLSKSDIQLTSRLGEGYFGIVSKGVWQGQDVAVKQLKEGVARGELENFEREARALCRLRHPNVTTFFGITLPPGPMIVSELLDGTLFNLVHCRSNTAQPAPPLPDAVKVRIVRDIAAGVNYLHSREPPMLHRDLSSVNVLVTGSAEDLTLHATSDRRVPFAKLTDFGLSRHVARDMTACCGNLAYMAPEVFRGSDYDLKADTYSFGILSYETLTEQQLYKGLKPLEAAQRAASPEALRPSIWATLLQTHMEHQQQQQQQLKGENGGGTGAAALPHGHGGHRDGRISVGQHFRDMIVACWETDPRNRPSFDVICAFLDQQVPIYAAGGRTSTSRMTRTSTVLPRNMVARQSNFLRNVGDASHRQPPQRGPHPLPAAVSGAAATAEPERVPSPSSAQTAVLNPLNTHARGMPGRGAGHCHHPLHQHHMHEHANTPTRVLPQDGHVAGHIRFQFPASRPDPTTGNAAIRPTGISNSAAVAAAASGASSAIVAPPVGDAYADGDALGAAASTEDAEEDSGPTQPPMSLA